MATEPSGMSERSGTSGRSDTTDVIVVGAGPAGLMLAGELRLGGARVVVLERLPEPTGQSRGLGFTARAMEVFDQRGLLPRFGPGLESGPEGHFGGIRFDYSVLQDAHFGARGVPQSQTEAVLEEWARSLGADIRRGWELTSLTQHADGVEVTAAAPDGERRLRAGYLVGCDGGHSTVRTAAGFAFPGTAGTREMYLADVAGCGIRPRFLGERLDSGMVMAAPLGDGVDRIIVCPYTAPAGERARQPDFAEVAGAWREITGEDISGGTALWVSAFTDATRQVTEYRRGRVLLAGDAAHVHLPAGGQGLSTGVQDAVNLGWKLAATVRGWAPPGLLDTYHSERHPVGARLLMNSHAQGTLYLGGADISPLRELFTELIGYADVRRHLAGVVSGLDIRYETGHGPGSHPLLGRRLPPRTVDTGAGPVSTASLLHPAQGLLLDLRGDASTGRAADGGPYGSQHGRLDGPQDDPQDDRQDGWKDRVLTVHARYAAPEPGDPLASAGAVLVRPDGHVVWTAADGGELGAALHRWFGPPEAAA